MLGLKRGTVALFPHSVEWEITAQKCIEHLNAILGAVAIDIQHIGSTSITGIKAKPIIDIVVGVRSFESVEPFLQNLEGNGFIFRIREVGNWLFACGDFEKDTRTHHIHFVIYGGTEWNDYIHFRDYLNAFSDKALLYEAEKIRLAGLYSTDRNAYCEEKGRVVQILLQEADDYFQKLDKLD